MADAPHGHCAGIGLGPIVIGMCMRSGGREFPAEPLRQAREACYALRDFVEKDPRWTQRRLRWDHVVVLPNTEVDEHFGLPDCPRWKVIDRNDLPSLVDRLREILRKQEFAAAIAVRVIRVEWAQEHLAVAAE